jgi:CubicO group peptidase (beta-lactamase class C family)
MKTLRFVGLASLLLAAGGPAFGQDAGLSGRVRSAMKRFVDEGEIAGAVAVVGDAKGVLAIEAVGLREVEGSAPMRPDTLFRIASMTKPITGIAVMMLIEEGKLGLDDPVAKHLPSFAGQMKLGWHQADAFIAERPSRPITLRDLLTHTSGLPDGPLADSPERDAKPPTTLAESAERHGHRRTRASTRSAGWSRSPRGCGSRTSSPGGSSGRSGWSTPPFTPPPSR